MNWSKIRWNICTIIVYLYFKVTLQCPSSFSAIPKNQLDTHTHSTSSKNESSFSICGFSPFCHNNPFRKSEHKMRWTVCVCVCVCVCVRERETARKKEKESLSVRREIKSHIKSACVCVSEREREREIWISLRWIISANKQTKITERDKSSTYSTER